MGYESYSPNSIRPRVSPIDTATLTATYTDNTFDISLISPGDTRLDTTDKFGKVMLYITYTLAVGQTNNDLNIQVESGNSTSNLYKMTTISVGSGVGTITETSLKYTGVDANTVWTIAVPIDLLDRVTRFSFKETNSTVFSTLSVDYVLIAHN